MIWLEGGYEGRSGRLQGLRQRPFPAPMRLKRACGRLLLGIFDQILKVTIQDIARDEILNGFLVSRKYVLKAVAFGDMLFRYTAIALCKSARVPPATRSQSPTGKCDRPDT